MKTISAATVSTSAASGALEHEGRYTIRTADGRLIYMRNCGLAEGDRTRFVAEFEAPQNSSFRHLHEGTYVGIREETVRGVRLQVYRNPVRGSQDEVLQTPADPGLRQQSWECPSVPAYANSGQEVLRANVGIGGFQSVGNSKNGSRRIIPITGGSFSGEVTGSVNPGGADYQLTVNGDLSLEARYTLRADNGDLILVRNCGDYGTGSLTVPVFEVAGSSPHAWLNEGDFVGTITPGLRRVTITVFERR